MPATFDDFGIRFLFPENWTLEADDSTTGHESASVYSPGGAFWSVLRHDPSDDLMELARAASEAIQLEYPDNNDREAAQEELEGVTMTGFDVSFFYLDLTNTAKVRAFRTAGGTYLVVCQAEDREFEQLKDVFRAITASLLRGAAQTVDNETKRQ